MTSTPDLSTIASKLSEAQRKAMVRIYRDGDPTSLHPGDPSISTLGVLARMGLLAGPAYSRNQQFTPLGTQLLSYLKEQAR